MRTDVGNTKVAPRLVSAKREREREGERFLPSDQREGERERGREREKGAKKVIEFDLVMVGRSVSSKFSKLCLLPLP